VHYPPNARVIALDPNPYMEDYYRKSMEKVFILFEHLTLVDSK